MAFRIYFHQVVFIDPLKLLPYPKGSPREDHPFHQSSHHDFYQQDHPFHLIYHRDYDPLFHLSHQSFRHGFYPLFTPFAPQTYYPRIIFNHPQVAFVFYPLEQGDEIYDS